MRPSQSSDPFVTVAYVYDQQELALLLSRFEDAGIWVVPLGYHHAAAQWNFTVALGGVQLLVLREEAQLAAELLARIEPRTFHSRIFSDHVFVDVILLVGLFLVGLFAPPARIPASFVIPPVADARLDS